MSEIMIQDTFVAVTIVGIVRLIAHLKFLTQFRSFLSPLCIHGDKRTVRMKELSAIVI